MGGAGHQGRWVWRCAKGGGEGGADLIEAEEEGDGAKGDGDAQRQRGDLIRDDDGKHGEVDETNRRVELGTWQVGVLRWR